MTSDREPGPHYRCHKCARGLSRQRRSCYSLATMMRAYPKSTGLTALLVVTLLTACASPGKFPTEEKTPSGQSLPGEPSALEVGGEVALKRGQYREAAMAYERAAAVASSEELSERAAHVAFENYQWTLAQSAADRWLQLNPTSEEAHRFAAFAALHLYRIDSAAEHLSMLLQTAFINPQAGFLALLPQISDEATAAGATAVLQKLVTKYPDLTEAHYALAQAAVQSDNFALALEHARKARELGQYWSPSGLLLARVQMLMGEHDAALETARKVVEEDRQDSYRLEYALMLMQAGREEEGRKELNALAALEGAGPVAERALADIDFQLGNRDAAAQRYSNLVQNGRFVYESLFYLGAIAEAREAWDDALQIYGRVNAGEFAMAAQTRAARIKAQRQGLDAGLKHLEEFAATKLQYRIDAIAARAALLAANGDTAGGLALLDSALKEYPDSAELRFVRVFQLESTDKVNESVNELRKLVADRPGDPAATNALGYILVDRTRQQREGLKLIEDSLAQTPDSGAVLDSMGWALHRAGRNEDALSYLERAKRRISDPEVDLHLGEILLALDRKSDAREVWSKASERYPDNAELKQRLQKLN
jgi:tetratricopeptide (TPR) repeat protein